MSLSRLRPASVLLKLACAGLLLGGAAQARNEACDAGSGQPSTACLRLMAAADVRTAKGGNESMAVVSGVRSGTAGVTRVLWPQDRRLDASPVAEQRPAAEAELHLSAGANEPPLLGLLLAVLGVVGFVAHRRSGR
jgi:hypothetical protein